MAADLSAKINGKSRILSAALAKVRACKKQNVITALLLSAAALFFVFGVSVTKSSPAIYYGGDAEAYSVTFVDLSEFSIFLFGCVVVCGFIICISIFGEMYNRQKADVSMSLPLSSKERFLSNLLAVGIMHVFPLIIVGALSSVLAVLINFSYAADVISECAGFLIYLMICDLFLVSVTMFCVCCCGTLAESVYISGLVMLDLVFLPELVKEHLIDYVTGLSTKSLIPIGFAVLGGFYDLSEASGYLKLLSAAALNLAVAAVLIILAGFLYKKRDARGVGDPIVFRGIFELIMASTLVFCLICSTNEGLFWVMTTISAVAYMIIRIVTKRGKVRFSDFLKWTAGFVAVAAGYCAVFAVSYLTDGFGTLKKAPNLDENKSYLVEVSVIGNGDIYNADQFRFASGFEEYDYMTNSIIFHYDYSVSARDAQNVAQGVFDRVSGEGKSLSGYYDCFMRNRGNERIQVYLDIDCDGEHISFNKTICEESAQEISEFLRGCPQLTEIGSYENVNYLRYY
ncbi:MAG: hypothetical protein ACI4JW_10975 [Oscillospiraceae bacterium]